MKSRVKRFFEKFFLINDTPEKIAGGFALGIFFGIFPGVGLVITLCIAAFFGLNRLAALSGAMATNTWLSVVLLPAAAFIGAKISDKDYADLAMQYKEGFDFGWEYFIGKVVFLDLTLPLLLGFFMIALIIAAAAYLAMYGLLKHNKIKIRK
ncbi:MAG: hypothetical protein QG620_111 [Patescibacteria group bacterium]|nr:hypothetical protein [Patescibacteria group bacterium]